MALNPVNVTISLATQAATVAGFGTQVFIGAHRWFSERIQTFSSLSDASDIPSDSEEYAALTMHFAQNPQQPIKIGRREADATLTPIDVDEDEVYTITIEVNGGDSVVCSYTVGAAEDAEDVVDGLLADITAATDVDAHITAAKTGSGASAVLDISATLSTDFFILSDASDNLTVSYTADEDPADTLDAIELEDTDYYGITAHDHTEAYALLMATQAEARNKDYLICVQDSNTLTAWNGITAATDTLAKLAELERLQTTAMWHHQADTIFPEVGVFSYFASRGDQPGTIAWTWETISGVPQAQDPNTGLRLSTTQKGYITARNANTFEVDGGFTIYAQGKNSNGEWTDNVTSKDFLTARITEGLKTLLYNKKKVSYTNLGINDVKSTVQTILDRYVETATVPNILDADKPYVLTFPKSEDVSFADKSNRVLVFSITMYLAGAITSFTVTGTLTYNANV